MGASPPLPASSAWARFLGSIAELLEGGEGRLGLESCLAAAISPFQALQAGLSPGEGAEWTWGEVEAVGSEASPRERAGLERLEELVRRAVESGEALQEVGEPGPVLAVAPLQHGPARALAVVRGSDRGPFTSADLSALRGCARLLGAALQVAGGKGRLEDRVADQDLALERQDFRLLSLQHTARVLGSALDLDELLRILPDMVAEILCVRVTLLCLFDVDETRLEVSGARSLTGEALPRFSVEVGEDFQEWLVTLRGQPVQVLPVQAQVLAEVVPDLVAELTRHGLDLVTPMIYKERPLGFLAVGGKYDGRAYEDRDREFLSTMAPLASNAIVNARLYDLAIHDGGTGLFVAHYFRRRISEELSRSRRYRLPLSLAILDLDFFKKVNDGHGHLVGDRVLREFAQILKGASRRDIDVVARYGGEEFVLLLPETPASGAEVMIERVRARVEEFGFCDGLLRVTTSGGIACFPEDGEDYQALLQVADERLYAAKRGGRNRIVGAASWAPPSPGQP